jgi:hypothetical protein
VLQPGLGAFSETLADKFEIAGWKVIRTRITTLRLWLQLWDTETGRMLWEAGAEATDAAQLLTQESAVSLEKIAERLWVRMIQGSPAGRADVVAILVRSLIVRAGPRTTPGSPRRGGGSLRRDAAGCRED